MSAKTRKIRLRFALYDSAYHTATGLHWAWYHTTLSPELLAKFYYSVIAPELTKKPLERPSAVLNGGFASVDDEWCCWFRLFDGGRDQRGRMGRFLLMSVFSSRAEAKSVDANWVFGLETLRAISVDAQKPPPLPPPANLELYLAAPIIALQSRSIGRLRRDGGLRPSAQHDVQITAAACSLAAHDEDWRLFLRGRREAPILEVQFTPGNNSPALKGDDTEDLDEVKEPIAGRKPPVVSRRERSGWRPLMFSAAAMATSVILVLIAATFLIKGFGHETNSEPDRTFQELARAGNPMLKKLSEDSRQTLKKSEAITLAILANEWEKALHDEQDNELKKKLQIGYDHCRQSIWDSESLLRAALADRQHETSVIANALVDMLEQNDRADDALQIRTKFLSKQQVAPPVP